MAVIEVWTGDITQLEVDAIVNAANNRLAGGGGLDGAIHRAAGYKKLQNACRNIGGCPTGEARFTRAFDLHAKGIIHAVGPVWHGGGGGESEALRSCYRQVMAIAADYKFESIAFPAISCGVYDYPLDAAVEIAVEEVVLCLSEDISISKVIFCCFNENLSSIYRLRLQAIGQLDRISSKPSGFTKRRIC